MDFAKFARVSMAALATERINSILACGIVLARVAGAIVDVVLTQRTVITILAVTSVLCVVGRI